MTNNALLDSKTNGRWTKQEHQKFILGLKLYGKDWKKIQALIGTRNGAQIRSHAQKFFIKIKKQSDNTEINDHWEQTKESSPENLASSVQSNLQSQTKTEYSYYLNKIVQRDALKETFDFWTALVDLKPLQEFETQLSQKRKNSFMSIRGEACNFEELQPTKRVEQQ